MPSIASSALAAGGRRRGWRLPVHLPAPVSHPATVQDSPNTDGYRRHWHRRAALAGNPAAPPDTAPRPHLGLCRPAGDSTSPTERRREERGSRLPWEFSTDRISFTEDVPGRSRRDVRCRQGWLNQHRLVTGTRRWGRNMRGAQRAAAQQGQKSPVY